MIGPDDLKDWEPEEWEEALAAHGRELWELETELDEPAFMQPPVDDTDEWDKLIDEWDEVPTPDEADVLSTTAGHTVKDETIRQPQSEHWIYAIVTTQTTGWYAGGGGAWQAGVRMNKGYSDRPYVSLVPKLDWGSRFRADIATARRAPERGDIKFLWVLPYNEPVTLEDCHTLFVEICRRFRFYKGSLYRKGAPRRIPSAEDRLGVVDDPWIPINVTGKKPKAFSTRDAGFTYPWVQKLLAGEDYKTPSLQIRQETPHYFVAESLATDRTMTAGFHSRTVYIPAKATKLLKERRDIFAQRSQFRLQMAADVKKKALRPALKILKEVSSDDKEGYKRLQKWESSYEASVDQVFFEDLWESVDQGQSEAQAKWKDRVTGFARRELERAKDTVSDTRKWKLWPEAKSKFDYEIRSL